MLFFNSDSILSEDCIDSIQFHFHQYSSIRFNLNYVVMVICCYVVQVNQHLFQMNSILIKIMIIFIRIANKAKKSNKVLVFIELNNITT